MSRKLGATLHRLPAAMLFCARASLGACLAICTGGCGPTCDNAVLDDVPSPDGRRHVVVFERSCGATTDVSTQVSILTRARDATGSGNVFVARTDRGHLPSGRGGPPVRVRWMDPRTIEIRYDARTRVFQKVARHDDTDVRYVVEEVANPP